MSKLSLTTILLFCISLFALFDVAYAAYNGNFWGNYLMIFWYWAAFIPFQLGAHMIPTTMMQKLRLVLGIAGIFALLFFAVRTLELWQGGFYSVLILAAIYICTGSYIWHYLSNRRQ